MSGEHELPTASVVRSSQATPARRRGQLCSRSQPGRVPLIAARFVFKRMGPPLAALLSSAQAADIDFSKPVEKVVPRTPIPLASTGADRVVEFALWKSAVPINDVVGKIESGLFCADSTPLKYTKGLDDWLLGQVTKSFREQAVSLGFALPETTKSVFEDKAGNGADFRLGATLTDLDYRTCGRETSKGDVYARVKWELFSARRQKVVYTAFIQSSYSSDKAMPSKDFEKQFVQVLVGNLLGDPQFVQVIRAGGATQDEPAKALAPLQLNPGQLVTGGVAGAAAKLLSAVVTVESSAGSGTAFYVSQDGYLLTNHHVVADSKFVRVKLAGGRSLVGEVLRVDRQRDVALVRTDPVPGGALILRRGDAQVGEEVYALGSPFGDVLSGTLTRGVLSSRRVFDGVAFLQSDVAVNPGSSGGPLIDAGGRVLGIAQLRSEAQGINLFIPIDDALDKLALIFTSTAPLPQSK